MSTKIEFECFRIFDEALAKIKKEIEAEQAGKQKNSSSKKSKGGVR